MTADAKPVRAWISPFEAAGEHVRLIPLDPRHEADLVTAVRDGDVWDTWFAAVPRPEGMAREIDWRLGLQEEGRMVPFTVLDATGRIVGMTSYMNVEPAHRRLEIGHTWYAGSVQRTALNTEAKLLLLSAAFDTYDCIAVGFRTAYFNFRSRTAIERLGAKYEGTWRSHMILPDGTIRDTCYYSIIAAEWPAVRRNLTWRLAHRRPSEQ
ncbi:GNAT family N-acetyltransferase [Microbacterium sp.]|uniref:GNAT family N-acetyltransferase n=1 Tax=Microbacterium sp. TaxID=51671 RepID=UPI0037CB1C84